MHLPSLKYLLRMSLKLRELFTNTFLCVSNICGKLQASHKVQEAHTKVMYNSHSTYNNSSGHAAVASYRVEEGKAEILHIKR